MGSDADDTLLVEILGGVLADVRDVGGQLFHTALGVTNFREIFINVDTCEDVPFDHLFGENDSVLIVVTLPRHEGYLEVASEGELTVLGGISLGKNLAGLDLVALADDRLQGDHGTLVSPSIYRKIIDSLLGAE